MAKPDLDPSHAGKFVTELVRQHNEQRENEERKSLKKDVDLVSPETIAKYQRDALDRLRSAGLMELFKAVAQSMRDIYPDAEARFSEPNGDLADPMVVGIFFDFRRSSTEVGDGMGVMTRVPDITYRQIYAVEPNREVGGSGDYVIRSGGRERKGQLGTLSGAQLKDEAYPRGPIGFRYEVDPETNLRIVTEFIADVVNFEHERFSIYEHQRPFNLIPLDQLHTQEA